MAVVYVRRCCVCVRAHGIVPPVCVLTTSSAVNVCDVSDGGLGTCECMNQLTVVIIVLGFKTFNFVSSVEKTDPATWHEGVDALHDSGLGCIRGCVWTARVL
jgi:hypothetical protein